STSNSRSVFAMAVAPMIISVSKRELRYTESKTQFRVDCMVSERRFGVYSGHLFMTNRAAYSAWEELGERSDGGSSTSITRYLSVPPRGILNSPAVTRMGYWSI